jgi:pyruvate/2-oxoacid:ferredoxin oxidoreductase alpha subunit/NAD-dependent dihydropyrimidine dehydrogenase PreA subunit
VTSTRTVSRPLLAPEYCKGCGRCLTACARGCIEAGHEIHPLSGLVPVRVDLSDCSGCALCFDACPEPYALRPEGARLLETSRRGEGTPDTVPSVRLPLPAGAPLVAKGTHACALGALLAGCRHFFGYPITPSSEGAELMAKLLPELDGVFLQAVSEVAAVNLMYGCGAAGLPSLTFTSSPGFSLMLEGISYMIGAELPGVFVNVMRGGPGLGNIAPEQSDIKLACRGLGHGNTHAVVLAPSSPQEMLDLTLLAFELAFAYRNPVVVVADGYLGQVTGRVELPRRFTQPGVPAWAVWGDARHRGNLVSSIHLSERELEAHNRYLVAKYAEIARREQRAELVRCDDADVVLLACNTPARTARGAVETLRARGVRAGLLRPQTLWPFPIRHLLPLAPRLRRLVVVEASHGQLEDELRLALSHAGATAPPIESLRSYGGVLPAERSIVDAVLAGEPVGRSQEPFA